MTVSVAQLKLMLTNPSGDCECPLYYPPVFPQSPPDPSLFWEIPHGSSIECLVFEPRPHFVANLLTQYFALLAVSIVLMTLTTIVAVLIILRLRGMPNNETGMKQMPSMRTSSNSADSQSYNRNQPAFEPTPVGLSKWKLISKQERQILKSTASLGLLLHTNEMPTIHDHPSISMYSAKECRPIRTTSIGTMTNRRPPPSIRPPPPPPRSDSPCSCCHWSSSEGEAEQNQSTLSPQGNGRESGYDTGGGVLPWCSPKSTAAVLLVHGVQQHPNSITYV